jgi:hypothetical protein
LELLVWLPLMPSPTMASLERLFHAPAMLLPSTLPRA